MSRAFVKEDGPDNTPLPDLPISPHPNYVTPRGLSQLQAALVEAQERLVALRAREDRLDRLPEAAAERDIRYFEARLKSAIAVASAGPCEVAGFGHRVKVVDADGEEASYSIVGEDEAEASLGRIAPQSPLARALIGAGVGDVVTWRRPVGAMELEILAIDWP